MTEPTATVPAEQVQTPPQQTSADPATTAPQENWKARYDGLVLKVQELTLANQTLTAQLAQKSSESEQLNAQLGIKDTEKQVAVGERDKKLQETLQLNSQLQSELDQLRALKLQVEVANELGHPELMKIASRLPAMTDKEALKTVMTDLANFANEQVQAREKQLLAGVTLPVGSGGNSPSTPSTPEGWTEHINSFQLGTKERQKALDAYGDWLERQHNPQR